MIVTFLRTHRQSVCEGQRTHTEEWVFSFYQAIPGIKVRSSGNGLSSLSTLGLFLVNYCMCLGLGMYMYVSAGTQRPAALDHLELEL